MNSAPNELEKAIASLSASFATQLDQMATGDFIREGVLKEAITYLIWDIYNRMPDQRRALAESLDNWPDLIAEAIAKDEAAERTE